MSPSPGVLHQSQSLPRGDPECWRYYCHLYMSLSGCGSPFPQNLGVLNPSDLNFSVSITVLACAPSVDKAWSRQPDSLGPALSASPAQTHLSLPGPSDCWLPPECGNGLLVFHNGPLIL